MSCVNASPGPLRRATHVNGPCRVPKIGVKNLAVAAEGRLPKKQKYLEVKIDKAEGMLPIDSSRQLHSFCASAYYPGEPDEVIKSRKTRVVRAKKHMGRARSPYEDVFFFETILLPYDPRQELVHIGIFQAEAGKSFQPSKSLAGRAVLQLADGSLQRPEEWPLARGDDFGGLVTVSVKIPARETWEAKVCSQNDWRTVPQPLSPSEFATSKMIGKFDKGGIAANPSQQPGDSSKSRREGDSRPGLVWKPMPNGLAGSCFGLELPVPYHPPSKAELNVLKIQMPQLAKAAPAVVAMVAEALRAPPIPRLAPMFAPMFAAATASYATPSAWVPCY